jgi:hypothetical protein
MGLVSSSYTNGQTRAAAPAVTNLSGQRSHLDILSVYAIYIL